MNAELPESGRFDAKPGIDVVRHLLTGAQTGTLVARRDSLRKALYVTAGRPAGAKSNQIQETLTRLAFSLRVVDEATYQAVLADIEAGRGPQGELMKQRGVPAAKVDALLQKQVALRFADVCTWTAGEYEWSAELPSTPWPECRVNPLAVFFEYVRLRYDGDTLRRAAEERSRWTLQVQQSLWFRFDRDFADLPQTREVAAKLLDGQGRPVGQLAPKGDPQAALRFWAGVWTLLEFGAVRLEEPSGHASNAAREAAAAAVPAEDVRTRDNSRRDPEIDARLEELTGKSWFEVLGVPHTADPAEIKRAYFKLAKQYHPDRYFEAATRTHNRSAEALFALISRAWDELRDDAKRATYRGYIERGTSEEEEMERAREILRSEVEFQKGQIQIKRRSFGEALQHFDAAIAMHPDEPEYHVYAAWCRFLLAGGQPGPVASASIETMRTALAQTRKHAEGWFFLGRMLKIVGDTSGARAAFEQVLKFDPQHREAPRELRALDTPAKTP